MKISRCRPAPEGAGILARLAFRRVQLVLADFGMVISSAEEFALLGRLLTGPAAGLCRRPGEFR